VPNDLDELMERATAALTATRYLDAEALCLRALAAARAADDWAYYARIVLPLQEARRQRRMIAAEGSVQLGTGAIGDLRAWAVEHAPACLVVTHPHTAGEAAGLVAAARDQQRYLEVLFANNPADQRWWTLRSIAGPAVTCEVDAPGRPDDSDWFLDACEALGDAALATVTAPAGTPARVAALEAVLDAAGDHEIAHQRLADAARAMTPETAT